MANVASRSKPAHNRVVRLAVLVIVLGSIALIWMQRGGMHALADRASAAGSSGSIVVVSATHPLPRNFAEPSLVALVGAVPVADKTVSVSTIVKSPLLKLFTAARNAGFDDLYVASGYRSADEQQRLWDASSDHSYVQRPGHSEHQTGLAVDLADLKDGAKGLEKSAAGRWLSDNSWKYGFILRYPPQKKAITGISYEPWHYRYVGRAVAETCYDNGWVLEEYVAAH